MLKYTKPELVKFEINVVHGGPDCANGSSVSVPNTCINGSAVSGGCYPGSIQFVTCLMGLEEWL